MNWNLTVLSQNSEGVLCSAPNGDTQWMTHQEYQKYLENRRKLVENSSL